MTKKFWAHVALAAVGLVALVWSLTLAAHPTVMCRGVEMHPGEVCVKADNTGRVQTYEDRVEAAQQSRPVVGAVGAAVAGFGGWLAYAEARKTRGRREA